MLLLIVENMTMLCFTMCGCIKGSLVDDTLDNNL